MATRSLNVAKKLASQYPWTTAPFLVGAPMRGLSGADLAVAVSGAGGIGFIGPRPKPDDWSPSLQKAKQLVEKARSEATSVLSGLQTTYPLLPVGIGFQVWTDSLQTAVVTVCTYKPCVVWLFAPRNGQPELDQWTSEIRRASPETQVWIQVGTVSEARDAFDSTSPPDVLVVQGADAGGHGRAKDGLGLTTLLPEISELSNRRNVPLLAAGGIVDGRGASAALCLGASGFAMGTRFLNAIEADIAKGYQQEIIRASEAATSTTRTQLYNHLRGITNWPDHWSPRAIINKSFHDYNAGVPFDTLKKAHDEASKAGDSGYGPDGRLGAYAGTGIGLIHDVKDAATIVKDTQKEASEILKTLASSIA
jgi:nitronate monooxygenase